MVSVQDMAKVDVKQLQTSLQRAEDEIREKTDGFVYKLNNRVNTVSLIEASSSSLTAANYYDLVNMKTSVSKPTRARSSRGNAAVGDASTVAALSSSSAMAIVDEVRELRALSPTTTQQQQAAAGGNNKQLRFYDLSPGQQVKVMQENKALFNPTNTRNRQALSDNYNIQLPLIDQRTRKSKVNHLQQTYE